MKLHYLIGDATKPAKNPAIIAHICNDVAGWGRGFVVALGNLYPEAKTAYKRWFQTDNPQLGQVQFVDTHVEGIIVANMIAQHGIRWQGKVPPIRYEALEACLRQVYDKAVEKGASVVAPRIGAVLAGGKWPRIESIIKDAMKVETYIYTLEEQKNKWPTIYERTNL